MQVAHEEDVDFVNINKARLRRRLQDRWHCPTPGHIHCFTKAEGLHIPLDEEAIEQWVTALHNGEATLVIPPKDSFQSSLTLIEPDDKEHFSLLRSSRTIQYQRPLRLQSLNAPLSGLRSIHTKHRASYVSSFNSHLSTLTGSSGVPGIGYLSGKAIKWLGVQMLDMFVPLEIFRRRRVIISLVKQLEKVPDQDRSKWILKRKRSINRAVEDLLELTSEQYKTYYRTTAINQGVRLRSLLASSFRTHSEESTYLCLLCVKLFPLLLLSNDNFSSEEFAGALRETLLQEPPDLVNESLLIAEIAAQLCFELAYGTSSPWRVEGYNALCDIYNTAHGSQSLQHLGRSGSLVDDLARTSFTNSPQPTSISEHARAIHFFAIYGNDMPEYRMHLLSPSGIPLSIEHLKSVCAEFATDFWGKELWNLCEEFAVISGFTWCVDVLLQNDICITLVKLLIFTQNINSPEGSWEGYDLVWTLRNLTFYGGNSGQQAVLDATTDDLRQILPHISGGIRKFWGDALALETQELIAETWP